MTRDKTKKINVGGVALGGGAPVTVQSMCNTDTRDVKTSLAQIRSLAAAGCDIIRLAVPDMAAAEAMADICRESPIPVVADIHFDYRLALRCAEAGVSKIRINPGNIGGEDRVRAVAEECGARGIPIRIGINAGSLEKRLLEKYGAPTPEAMVESAAGHVALLEKFGFYDICLSLKASSVPTTLAAYRLAANAASPSASESTPALWKSACWRSTAPPRRRQWSRARRATLRFWRSSAFMISAFR